MLDKYLEQDCIVCHSYEAAASIQKVLVEEGYAAMITTEEQLWCVNWVWTESFSNRNDVIFVNRGNYECEWDAFVKRHPEIDWSKEDEI